jgi:hypothetical protein
MPLLVESFPLVHPEGMRWMQLSVECARCSHEIPNSHVRGRVTFIPARKGFWARLTRKTRPSTFALNALGLCEPCRLLTPFRYQLHSDSTMTGEHPVTGKEETWKGYTPEPSPTAWDRVQKDSFDD